MRLTPMNTAQKIIATVLICFNTVGMIYLSFSHTIVTLISVATLIVIFFPSNKVKD